MTHGFVGEVHASNVTLNQQYPNELPVSRAEYQNFVNAVGGLSVAADEVPPHIARKPVSDHFMINYVNRIAAQRGRNIRP